ncbi:MAG: hypothetical protein CMLOHMNK_02372 [Steroidobacteraceae bacterium]|nr:hypothetical protein [Steroidobacteraceae bacterium]
MLPPNPDYGRGIFRRQVRIRAGVREVHVDLEDSNHAFRLVLRHDGERVTAIEPQYVRHPFTTCPESSRFLVATLVGRSLAGMPDIRRALETRYSCTHVTDMTALALGHVDEAGFERLYDIAVDDEREGRTRARIRRDGQPVHEWIIARHAIVEPAALAGRPMMQGFFAWARETFTDPAFEAATMLQRGYFVAQARRSEPTPERDHPAIGDGMPQGVCYSYSSPAVERATRIVGSRRDFTQDTGALLNFER